MIDKRILVLKCPQCGHEANLSHVKNGEDFQITNCCDWELEIECPNCSHRETY